MPAKPENKKALTLSIIIPVYNEEDYIAGCLDAIAAQAAAPDQVLVVDNNSTDRTVAIAEAYDFVTVLAEPRQGIVHARNAGFNAATGDIIGRIDADTRLNPDWVSSVLELAGGSSADTAFTGPCRFRDWRGKMLLFWGHRIVYFWSSYLFLGHHTLFGSNMFLPRALWQKHRAGVCLQTNIHEDMDLSIHIRRAGGKVRFSGKLKATISPRRIYRMSHYPAMWLRTQLVRHQA